MRRAFGSQALCEASPSVPVPLLSLSLPVCVQQVSLPQDGVRRRPREEGAARALRRRRPRPAAPPRNALVIWFPSSSMHFHPDKGLFTSLAACCTCKGKPASQLGRAYTTFSPERLRALRERHAYVAWADWLALLTRRSLLPGVKNLFIAWLGLAGGGPREKFMLQNVVALYFDFDSSS